jgi:XRE family transcriptional regulator, regulator of sulfur utilization
MPDNLPEFRAAVRDRAQKLGLNFSQLARQVGISSSQMGNIVNGENLPSLPVYVKIVRALKAGKIPLIGGEDA